MPLFALSDLHLDDRHRATLFDDARQGRHLAALFETLARVPDAELVLLGDTFDFTSMQPPLRGLEHFCDALELPLEVQPARDVTAMLEAIAKANPIAFEALRTVAQRVPTTFVVGNHDWQLGNPEARTALASVGVPSGIAKRVLRQLGGRGVLLEHGHRFDASNAHPLADGEQLTRALYQAVIPFLRHHGARENVRMDVDRLVAVRPQERALMLMERWLDSHTFHRLMHAFLRLLAENRGMSRPAQVLAERLPVKLMRSALESAEEVWRKAADHVLNDLARRHPRELHAEADVVVLGHTHVLDWAVSDVRGRDKLYVNLGTWTERAVDAMSAADTTLPLLMLDGARDLFAAELIDLDEDGGKLETFRGRSLSPELASLGSESRP